MFVRLYLSGIDVCLGTKIRILKQITTCIAVVAHDVGCLSWHKDTNFKANHNQCTNGRKSKSDVCLGTKIRILKQITTKELDFTFGNGCLSWHKDTNFKANHNLKNDYWCKGLDVCLGTKIRILKQITTKRIVKKSVCVMFVLAQRYEF